MFMQNWSLLVTFKYVHKKDFFILISIISIEKFETMPRQSAKSYPAVLGRGRPKRAKYVQANPHLSKDTHVVEGSLHQENRQVSESKEGKLLLPLKDDNLAQTFVSGGESSNLVEKIEKSQILLLARDIQRLENYLSSEIEKLCPKLVQDAGCSDYYQLSVLTAAKIILFNKPRANKAMQLSIASFIEQSTKLDPADETLQCLSSVEKKLCERLDVVETPDKDGKTIPILLTPKTKKAVDLLVNKRSQVNIPPDNPYIFAKLIDRMISSMKVLHTVTENVGLDNPGLLQDTRLQKHVALISQTMAMLDNELDWLSSHIANSGATEEDYCSSPQISAQELAQVVQLLHGSDYGQSKHITDQILSELQSSEFVSSAKDSCPPHPLDDKLIPPKCLLKDKSPARKLVVNLRDISKYLVKTGQDFKNITEGSSVGIKHMSDGVQKVYVGDKPSVRRSSRKCRPKEPAWDNSFVMGSSRKHIQKVRAQDRASVMTSSTCESPLACKVSRVQLKKRSAVCKTSKTLPVGVLLTDGDDSWMLGSSIGKSGFGEIYRATFKSKAESHFSIKEFHAHLIKIEPKHDDAIFHQLELYQTATKPGNIDKWKDEHRVKYLAIPKHVAFGQYEHNGVMHNFVVLEKIGKDLHYKLRMRNHHLEPRLAYNIAIHLVNAVEYLHSYGFVHADIKPANIVICHGPLREGISRVVLVDFGVAPACKQNGFSKKFICAMQKARECALEYTSRDAHSAVLPTKRGDIETLAYNLIHWLSGKLPWEGMEDKDEVSHLKTVNMKKIHYFLSNCFGERIYAPQLYLLLKYVSTLGYEETPDYSHVRRLLKKANRYHKRLIPQFIPPLIPQAKYKREKERPKMKMKKEKMSQKNKKGKASKKKLRVLAPKGGFLSPGTSKLPVNPGTSNVPVNPGTSNVPVNPGTSNVPVNPGTSNVPFNPGTSNVPINPGTPSVPVNPPSQKILNQRASTSLPAQPGPSKRIFFLPPKSDQPGLVVVTSPVSTTLPAQPGRLKRIVAKPCLKRKSNSDANLGLRKRIGTVEDSKGSFSRKQKAAEPVPRQKIVLIPQNDKEAQPPVTYAVVLPQVPPSEQPKVNSINLGVPAVKGLLAVCEGNGNKTTVGILSNKDSTNGSTGGILDNSIVTSRSIDGMHSNNHRASWSTDGILCNNSVASWSADGISNNKDYTSWSNDGILSNNSMASLSADGILSNKEYTSGSSDGILRNNSVASWSADGISNNKDYTSGSSNGILRNNSVASLSADGILSNKDNTNLATDGSLNNESYTSGEIKRENLTQIGDFVKFDASDGEFRLSSMRGKPQCATVCVMGWNFRPLHKQCTLPSYMLLDLTVQVKTEPDDLEHREKEMNSGREIVQETWRVMVEDAMSCDDVKPDPDVENGEGISGQGVDQSEKTYERSTSPETGADIKPDPDGENGEGVLGQGVNQSEKTHERSIFPETDDDVKPEPDGENGEGVLGQGVNQSEKTHERSIFPETDQEAMESISANQNSDANFSSENRVAFSNDPRNRDMNLNSGKKDPRPAPGHACMFCGVLLSEMVDHLISAHKNEKLVQEALSVQQALEQKAALEELKMYGDHCHNIQFLQRRKGTLIVLKEDQSKVKRPANPCLEDYLPCPECLGYAYYGDFLRHRMQCDAFYTRMRSFCGKTHLKERNSQAMKNKAVITFVNTGISEAKVMRNIFIIMLSDILKLEKDFEKMKCYNKSMMKAVCVETVSYLTCNTSEMWQLLEVVRQVDTCDSPLFFPEKVDVLFRLIKWLYDQSMLKDRLHSYENEIGYLAMVIRNALTSCAIKLKDKASAARDSNILSRADQFISMFGSMARNDRIYVAAIPKHVLNLQRRNNTSDEKNTLNNSVKVDLSDIQSLVSYVRKLENYLNPEIEKNYKQLGKRPDRTGYLGLSLATAAKIVLLNKPRANEAMQLRVQSYFEESSNYDSQDNTSECLTAVEKTLCERLHVVKTSDKEGQMVPILLTPKIKDAVELLLAKRRVVNIHPKNPYIFAKWDRLMDGMKASTVLSTIAMNVRLDLDCFQDARLQNYVATISQIMAMQKNELDWLKSHIANSLTGDIDVQNVQSSPLQMAKVVQLLCENDSGETQVSTVHEEEMHHLHDAQQITPNPHEQSAHTNRNCTLPSGSNYHLVPDGSNGLVSFERNYPAPDFSNCQAPDVNIRPEPDGSLGQVSFERNYPAPDFSNCQVPQADFTNYCPEPDSRNVQAFFVRNCPIPDASSCQNPDGNRPQVPDANNCQIPNNSNDYSASDFSSCQIADDSNGYVSCDRNYPAPNFSNCQMLVAKKCPEPFDRSYQVPDYNSSQVPNSRLSAQSHSPQYNVENQCHFTKESVTNLLEPDSVNTDITDIVEDSVEEPQEEKYSDVLRRTGLLTSPTNTQEVSDISNCVGKEEVKIEKDAN